MPKKTPEQLLIKEITTKFYKLTADFDALSTAHKKHMAIVDNRMDAMNELFNKLDDLEAR